MTENALLAAIDAFTRSATTRRARAASSGCRELGLPATRSSALRRRRAALRQGAAASRSSAAPSPTTSSSSTPTPTSGSSTSSSGRWTAIPRRCARVDRRRPALPRHDPPPRARRAAQRSTPASGRPARRRRADPDALSQVARAARRAAVVRRAAPLERLYGHSASGGPRAAVCARCASSTSSARS